MSFTHFIVQTLARLTLDPVIYHTNYVRQQPISNHSITNYKRILKVHLTKAILSDFTYIYSLWNFIFYRKKLWLRLIINRLWRFTGYINVYKERFWCSRRIYTIHTHKFWLSCLYAHTKFRYLKRKQLCLSVFGRYHRK